MNAYINRIATAVPDHDVHVAFVDFASNLLRDERARALFLRMAERSAIHHRYSWLQCGPAEGVFSVLAHEFYSRGNFPSTGTRMEHFEQFAPALAYRALDNLKLSAEEKRGITHVVVTCCTGHYAPGLDFEIMDYLGLDTSVERTMIGFMGCYAAMNALKVARHAVRSEPSSKVLILNLELCTLHLQETQDLNQILSFLIFGDGCAATLVSAENTGLALDSFRTVLIPDTRDLITWRIRDLGFDMFLSGKVPVSIGKSLKTGWEEITAGASPQSIPLWAVHPGGQSVLDSVENALELPKSALMSSRDVLCRFGNMSSATLMFVLDHLMQRANPGERGCAMAFGPGLTAETLLFHAE
jgi:predicted naringenin-chalcone synthase